jgi:hypothetical protein
MKKPHDFSNDDRMKKDASTKVQSNHCSHMERITVHRYREWRYPLGTTSLVVDDPATSTSSTDFKHAVGTHISQTIPHLPTGKFPCNIHQLIFQTLHWKQHLT